MADEQQTEEEPSIEEILDSIRQIISDDDEEAAEEEVAAAPEPEPESTIDPEEVIELTDKIDDEPEPEVVAPEPEPVQEPEPEPEPVFEEPPIEVDMTDASDDSILTSNAQRAAYDGFTELAKKTAVEHNGITLEEIVRTELNPLLRDWLDKNLPSIIERLVQEELERISKRTLED